MRHDVEVYAERPDPLAGDDRWACGTGYLLAGRLVLTAAHVVCCGGIPLVTVQVRGEDGQLYAATVVWSHADAGIDVALVEVCDPAWLEPHWRHTVRYGRFVTGRAGQACDAVGYPRAVATPEQRDTHHAIGSISPRSLLKAGLLAMDVSNPPSAPTAAGSGWAGMSGAGVCCAGILIGVVTTDPAGFDSRRLVTTPIVAFADDPSFSQLIHQHTGNALVLEAAEFSGLAYRPQPPISPADLLRAEAEAAPFRDRPELGQLLDWCQDPDWFSVRLVAGPGGQGKSRLAQQLKHELTKSRAGVGLSGWAGFILDDHATTSELEILAAVTLPTLVIVDYAEGRGTQLDPLFAASARAVAKVRILLLARTASAWRTDRVAPAAHLEILADDRIVMPLAPLVHGSAGREAAWWEAVSAFADRLGQLQGYQRVAWSNLIPGLQTPVLPPDGFRTVLAVQMDALAALLRAYDSASTLDHPGHRVDAEEVLLSHEHRYWSRVANEHHVNLSPATQRCLVAMATLWGANGSGDACRLVAAALGRPRHDDAVTNTATWLGTLYQSGERYWSGLQPDLLGEYLVAAAFSKGGSCPDLVANTRAFATADELERGLTVLGRAHQHHPDLHDNLTDTARLTGLTGALAAITVATRLPEPGPLLAAVEKFLEASDLQALLELSGALPRFSLLLGPLALSNASGLVQRLREAVEGDRDAYLPELAGSISDLGVRLGEAGRRTEGLTAAQEAVELHRELAESNRETYLPDLAVSISNLAVDLAQVGRRTEGLTLAQEAVGLRRELAENNRETYLPDLAASINNLAIHLAQAGRPTEALTAAQQAVDQYRELAESNPETYLPDLAMSLDNLASRLSEVVRPTEALTAAQQAVDLRRELTENNRDAYLPDLAASINNLASRLSEAGRVAEGLTAAREAVDLCRELAESNPETYLPELASSINNLAIRLAQAGRPTQALTFAHEAVDQYRELAESNPETYLPELASSINNLAIHLAQAGRPTQALTFAHEAVNQYRELAESKPETYLPDLAMSLDNLANRLGEAGRGAEGLTAAHEAVHLRRELTENNRDAYLPDLAASINNLASRLKQAGREAEGMTAAQEAVHLRRELTENNRDAHLPDLAASINDLAIDLAQMGRRTEGLTLAQETVDLRRELAESNRGTYLPDLATSINNLANRLSEAGRLNESLTAAQEAVDLRRELAENNWDAHLPDLATSINNLAIHLAQAGRPTEALTAAQRAVDLRRELAGSNRGAYLPDLATSLDNLAHRLSEAGRLNEALTAAQRAVELHRELTSSNPGAFRPGLHKALDLAAYLKRKK